MVCIDFCSTVMEGAFDTSDMISDGEDTVAEVKGLGARIIWPEVQALDGDMTGYGWSIP